jgi:hypothetical protein
MSRPAATKVARVGDPSLRPEEDHLIVPTSFEIERELRDWEGCTLVTWAMNVPPSTTARNLEDTIVRQFRLQPCDVSVTRHRPEAFLIRLQHRRHCEDVLARDKFQYHGADVCVRQWRSLTGALAATLFYRLRIVLDGVPRHAWLPNIAERLIGRTCSLQCIDTNLLHPTDTRGIELWAWTENPSRIPKVMWLTFTSGSMEGSSSSWQVSEFPRRAGSAAFGTVSTCTCGRFTTMQVSPLTPTTRTPPLGSLTSGVSPGSGASRTVCPR